MPANTHIFLLGLAVATGLLVFGVFLGYRLGRKSVSADTIDRQKFLSFLQNLSSWTNEVSVVVSSYLAEARTDGLTDLFNRRAFDKAVDVLFADWSKKGQSFSLGLIDIDHFKQINDTYGHPAGDAVLKQIAQTLQAELGDAVCVARYGGEEFAVLSMASSESTAAMFDKLRQAVGGLLVIHDSHVISVTLSAGVAQIEADDKIGKLVRRADEALYAAKLGGRNRVYLHEGAACRLFAQGTPEPLFPK